MSDVDDMDILSGKPESIRYKAPISGADIVCCSFPTPEELEALLAEGYQDIVDLSHEHERWWFTLPYDTARVRRHARPIQTQDLKSLQETFPDVEQFLALVDEIRALGKAAVHCRHGLDRSGAVAITLAMTEGLCFDEASRMVSSAAGRPIPRKASWEAYLHKVEAKIAARGRSA